MGIRSPALAHLDYLDETIVTLSDEIAGRLIPFAPTVTCLQTSRA